MTGEHLPGLFRPPPPAVVAAVGARAWAEAILRFEVALALAEEEIGVIPPGSGRAIAAAAGELDVDLDLLRTAPTPVIALVDLLAHAAGPDTGRHVHHGATSQDAMDTALAIVARDAAAAILEHVAAAESTLARLADEHRRSVMPGRTLMQHASPTTFGVKCAMWLSALTDAARSVAADIEGLPIQLAGAAGTSAVLGADAERVTSAVARLLELPGPESAWHTNRIPVARVAASLGILTGTIGKIASDIVLLAQTEVAEVAEHSEGASSAMPHKRNPASAIDAVASARQAAALAGLLLGSLDHEHERAAGAWQAEPETVSTLFLHAGRAAASLEWSLSGLLVDTARMRANLDPAGSWASELVAARLATVLGRDVARDVVREALAGGSLRDGLAADARCAAHVDALADVLDDALLAAGPVDEIVDSALKQAR